MSALSILDFKTECQKPELQYPINSNAAAEYFASPCDDENNRSLIGADRALITLACLVNESSYIGQRRNIKNTDQMVALMREQELKWIAITRRIAKKTGTSFRPDLFRKTAHAYSPDLKTMW